MSFSAGQTVKWTGLIYKIHSLSEDGERTQLVNPDGLYAIAPIGQLTPLVTITYFKTSGKYYTEDKNVEWPRDEVHFTGWAAFSSLVRLRDMFALCMETPLGFPTFSYPSNSDSLDAIDERATRIREEGEPHDEQRTCLQCSGTCAAVGAGVLRSCPKCKGRGTIDVVEFGAGDRYKFDLYGVQDDNGANCPSYVHLGSFDSERQARMAIREEHAHAVPRIRVGWRREVITLDIDADVYFVIEPKSDAEHGEDDAADD